MTEYLFAKVYFMFYQLILFFVTLWQKTRIMRSFFQFSQCRFYPSCSDYFLQSLKRHGLVSGTIFSLKRFIRCNPLCAGGVDEVPNAKRDMLCTKLHTQNSIHSR